MSKVQPSPSPNASRDSEIDRANQFPAGISFHPPNLVLPTRMSRAVGAYESLVTMTLALPQAGMGRAFGP